MVNEVVVASMGLRSLLMVEKKSLGVFTARLDDGGVVGGACFVEDISVLLLVKIVHVRMDSETAFL